MEITSPKTPARSRPQRLLWECACLLGLLSTATASAQTTVLEWNFSNAAAPWKASTVHAAVASTSVSLQGNDNIALIRRSVSPTYASVGTEWLGSEDARFTATRTSLNPRVAKSISTTFTLGAQANGDWSDLALSLSYRRTATAPSKARAVLTWQQGAVFKRRYTSVMLLSGSTWGVCSAEFQQGDVLPASLAGLPCLLEIYCWGNSVTPNSVEIDDLRLQCGSLNSAFSVYPASLNDWPQGRPYSAQFSVPGYAGTLAWSFSGALPGGLTFNTSQGTITGTPLGVESTSFTVTAVGAGFSKSVTCSLNIVDPPVTPPTTNCVAKLTFDGDVSEASPGPLAPGDVSSCFTEVCYGYDAASGLVSSLVAGGSQSSGGVPINLARSGQVRALRGWDAAQAYGTSRTSLLPFTVATSVDQARFNVYPPTNTASLPLTSKTTTGEGSVWQTRVKFDPNASGSLGVFYFDALRWQQDRMDVSGANGPRWASVHAYWTNDSGVMQRWDSATIDVQAVYLPEHRGTNQFVRYGINLNDGPTGLNQRIRTTAAKYRSRTIYFDLYFWHDAGASLAEATGAHPPVILLDEVGITGNFTTSVPTVGIGNTIFNDRNYNGHFDPGEGVGGVKVELLNTSSVVLQSTLTTTGGNYSFTGLAEGAYRVRVPASEFASGKPLFQMTSVPGNGIDSGIDDSGDENGIDNASPNINGIKTGVIALTSDSEPTTSETGNNPDVDSADDDNIDLTVDLGFVASPLFGLGDRVYADANANGTYDPGEGIDGVTVQLLDSEGTQLASQVTSNGGFYTFSSQPTTQSYKVRVAASNFSSGSALEGAVSITGNGTDDGIDLDDNGVDDASPTTNGVVSTLIAPDTTQGGTFSYVWPPSATATLGNEGGTWYQVTLRNNYVTATMDVAVTLDTATQNTQALWMLITNGTLPSALDPNYAAIYLANGVATVAPYGGNPTVTHRLGTIITTAPYTVTNIGTKRTFRFSLNTAVVNQWSQRPPSWLGTGFPYDALGTCPDAFNKRAGVRIRSFADGACSLTGSTWNVTWGAGADPNIGTYEDNAVLTIIGCDTTVDLGFQQTNDFGDFSGFVNASSAVDTRLRLGTLVDAEAMLVINPSATGDDANGVDDEDGVTMPTSVSAGSTVTLPVRVYNRTGSIAYLSAWMDFNNDGVLNNTLVSAGGEKLRSEQSVSSNATTQTVNFTFTVPAGASVGSGRGVRFRLSSQSVIPPTGQRGFGEVEDYAVTIAPSSLSIGNLVWSDANNNGTKDASEIGIGGVTVQLFSAGGDNLANTGDDVQVGANVTTSASGVYQFTGLSAGKYFVKVTPPSSYPLTSGTPVLTDNNVDNNNDGAQPGGAGTALFSPVIDLAAGAEPINDGDTDPNTNTTVDFGLFSGFTVGNTVFNDANNNGTQDVGESGISGVGMELLNATTSAVLATTTTNGSGQYGFLVYSAGSYKVRATPISTYPLASTIVGTDNGSDSNNDGTQSGLAGTASTSFTFALAAGGEPGTLGTTNAENTIDFGFRACATIAVSPSSLTAANINAASSTTISATGGTAPYTFSVSAGTLPSGITLNPSTGLMSGTPTTTGTYPFTVRATDAKGCTGAVNYSWLIQSAPTLDFGDYAAFGSASSTVDTRLRMGSLVDAESSAQTNDAATGDDENGSADEDGLTLPGSIAAGGVSQISVQVTNATSSPGYLNAWIDFNHNGVVTDAGEQIATNTVVAAGAANSTITITFTSPVTLLEGFTGMRLRLTSVLSPGSTGSVGIGEVTDCVLRSCASLGFAYGTGHGNLYEIEVGTGKVRIATAVPSGFTAANGAAFAQTLGADGAVIFATGLSTDQRLAVWDRTTGVINVAGNLRTFGYPSSGVIHSGDFYQGYYYLVTDSTDDLWKVGFTGSSGSYAITSATKVADLWSNTRSHSYGDIVITTAGILYAHCSRNNSTATDFYTANLNVATPVATLLGNPPYMHNGITLGLDGRLYGGLGVNNLNKDWFQVSLLTGGSTYLNPGFVTGLSDMTMGACTPSAVVVNQPTDIDYGDFSEFAAASSIVDQALRLGSQVDIDTNFSANLTATGDDATGVDDEDGVTLPVSIAVGGSGTVSIRVTNTTGSAAYLSGWIDLNGDGSLLDAGEQFITNVPIATGTSNVAQTYTLNVPATAVVGVTGVRFRLCSVSNASPTGESGTGEIEDYVVNIACPTITIAPTSLASAYVATNYSAQLSASGGLSPYTWAVVAGSLPAGITLNTTTGALSGTAPSTPGAYAVTFAATDAAGCTGQTASMNFAVVGLSIGNQVWADTTCNGRFDVGESGIVGATLQLYTRGTDNIAYTLDDVLVATTTSGSDGSYAFAGLSPGDYWIKLTPSVGYPLITPTNVLLDNRVDNDSNGEQPGGGGAAIRSPVVTLSPGTEPTTEDSDNNTDLTVDFGLRPGFTVGDLVFSDDNNNGTRDVGEAGIPNVSVALMTPGGDSDVGGGDDSVIATTTTDAAGAYSFTVLSPGIYFVRVTPVSGYDVPSGPVGLLDNGVENDNNGEQPDGATTLIYSPVFGLAQCTEPGTTGTSNAESSIDIGLVPSVLGLGNVVFDDLDGNNHFDSSEGIDNITVELYASNQMPGVDAPLATTSTSNGGRYLFEHLTRRGYVVHLPKAQFGAGGLLRGMFSVPGVQLDGGDDDVGEDGLDAIDPALTGITTHVVNMDFNSLPTNPGVPSNVTANSGKETGFDSTADNSPTAKDDDYDLMLDVGLYRRVSVGNLVFVDTNGNGHADAGEGVNGVLVELYQGSTAIGDPLASAFTANGGLYLFSDLQPGLYVVHIPASNFVGAGLLVGKLSIAQGQFGDDDVGEDGQNDTEPETQGVSSSPVFLLASTCPTAQNGESGLNSASDNDIDASVDLTIDFGFQSAVAVGNVVFAEASNGNGHYDAGEGVDGVVVELYRTGSTPGYSLPAATVVTSGGGHYLFTGLAGGTYFVHLPADNFDVGHALEGKMSMPGVAVANTDDNVGEDGLDAVSAAMSGISSSEFTLVAGSMPTNALGESGFSNTDDDANSQDANGNMTIDFGFVPLDTNRVGLGNTVFSDLNGNGHYDEGEGINGVRVELYLDATNTLVATTTTAGGGLYFFGNLAPGGYYVKIPSSNWASGTGKLNGMFVLSNPGDGNDGNDDDADQNGIETLPQQTNGVRSSRVDLSIGGEPSDFDSELGNNTTSDAGIDTNIDLTIDFGFYKPVGVGNLVYVDANGNGHADAGEGVAGVTVELYRPVAGLGSELVDTKVTDTASKGKFLFTGLRPGVYFLRIPPAMFQSTGPLVGKLSMVGVQGGQGDDSSGEDGVDSPDLPGQGLTTDLFQLIPGSMASGTAENGLFANDDNGSTDVDIDLTQDFGFTANVCVGNLVFKDLDLDGKFTAGVDQGVDNVTVQLWQQLSGGGEVFISDTVTANEGVYSFCVPAGTYSIRIPAAMFEAGAVLANTQATTLGSTTLTQDDNVSQDATDGGNAVLNGATTAWFPLVVGTMPIDATTETGFGKTADNTIDADSDLTIDLGFKPLPLTVGNLVFRDNNANGRYDVGDTGISGVTVKLFNYDANPLTATPVATTTTGIDGSYTLQAFVQAPYIVHVAASNFGTGQPLLGLLSSVGNDSGTGDDDVNENGIDATTPATTGISSNIISLVYAGMPTDGSGESGFLKTTDNVIDENGNLTVDFGFRSPGGAPAAQHVTNVLVTTDAAEPSSFVQWQALHAGVADPAADADHDGASNLLEYALGTDPQSGVHVSARFRLERGAGIDAVLVRPAATHNDLRYTLQGSTDSQHWTPLGTRSVSSFVGSEEVLRFASISSDTALDSSKTGYVRVQITLDADLDGIAEATASTPVHAFTVQALPVGQTTLSIPMQRASIYTGMISSVGDRTLGITGGEGFSAAMQQGTSYVAEVKDGSFAGHRFDLDAATSTDAALSLDLASKRNTLAALPSSLVGATISVRPQWTLATLVPANAMRAGSNVTTADRVMRYENGVYRVHWLYQARDGARWLLGNAGTDTGSTVIADGEGVIVHARTQSVSLALMGEVRTTALRYPPAPSSLIGSGSTVAMPLPASFVGERVRLWDGDSTPGALSFSSYVFTDAGWAAESDGSNVTAQSLLQPYRAVFLIRP